MRHTLFAALAGLFLLGSITAMPRPAQAQATPYLGQIMVVPYNFCPTGWLPANGQLLPISNYTAVFALIGTTYGGDGVRNFALPALKPIYAVNGAMLLQCIDITGGVFPPRP